MCEEEKSAATDEAPGPSATTSASLPQKSSLASSRSARPGSRSRRACVGRMSSSSSLVEVQVLSPLALGAARPLPSYARAAMAEVSHERPALIFSRRSERPPHGVGSSTQCSCLLAVPNRPADFSSPSLPARQPRPSASPPSCRSSPTRASRTFPTTRPVPRSPASLAHGRGQAHTASSRAPRHRTPASPRARAWAPMAPQRCTTSSVA